MSISRRGLFGLAGGLAAASVAGCGFAPTNSGGAANNSLTFRWWGGEARNKAYQNALQIFTQKTGTKVDAQYSGYDGYFNKLNTEFAGGNPPDLFQMDTALVSTYAAQGVLTDLSSFIPSTIHLDTLYPAVRQAGAVDGKTYGVPSGSGFAPILYDKTIFEQAKIPVPPDTWTWDDFGRIAGELSKAMGQGKYGALDASKDDSGALQPWLRQRGKDLYNAEGKLAFTKDDLAEWFALWDKLRKAGAICPPEMLSSTDSATGNHPLISGSIAMTTGWGLAQMAPLTQHTLDIVVVPRGSNGKTGQALSGGVLLCIPVKSKNPEAAAKLIDLFVSDVEAIKAMAMTRGIPPSSKALEALTPTLTASDKRDVTYAQYVADEVAKDGLPPAPTAPPGYNDAKTALDAAAKQVAFGKMSIPDAVAQYFRDAEAALNGAK
ncbi:carbohydrate ABC transporter substrate-binding protein (CUT1 family) [Lentzea atacamensis]|uniref:Carbohydrate ABC transporter substrate-binding protein (CUT1 family) n=2 Tax=Lentzea TaxID=165301 RepID=A0A316HJL3_9PSEU|nr:sugar ABC transporter substrate-binding protein [Lentzea atacamensis]PWK81402.1 carbohydrate ABC transporter substrate-binding protein (CUT1 family) [Lentzea atacamensis]RAS70549.1 carbohydrate ABC transporter substrate-binding protein (CUT1 family) [Lentzea atacamensis]